MKKANCLACLWCVPTDVSYREFSGMFPAQYECWNDDAVAAGCFPDAAHLCYGFCQMANPPEAVKNRLAEIWEERYGIVTIS